MRLLFYTHSLVSCWNHGNAHFLRGVMRALQAAGHQVRALEPEGGWSRTNLQATDPDAEGAFAAAFPDLRSDSYGGGFDHEGAVADADAVIVHEWTDPALVGRLGRARAGGGRFRLLFHDTHHRAVSAGDEIGALDLSGYDGVLAFGAALADRYARAGWGRQAFVWHEAADVTLFQPKPEVGTSEDLVWIGNYGDGERAAELERFLFGPLERLGLTARIHGVRYPPEVLRRLAAAGITHAGWLPNAQVPDAFARHRVTVHVPRAPYVTALPGIPTIRVFEALACGIPLVSAPWDDAEGLFRPGDFRMVRDGAGMEGALRDLLDDPAMAAEQAARGRATILDRHTCAHRAAELLAVLGSLDAERGAA